MAFADKMGPDFQQVGVIVDPSASKAELGQITKEEARSRGVGTLYAFFFASRADVQKDNAFAGAQLDKGKLNVDGGS